MQILPVIMRLLVILSVSLSVVRASGTLVNYSADAVTVTSTGGATMAAIRTEQNSSADTLLVLRRPKGASMMGSVSDNGAMLPRQRSIDLIGGQPTVRTDTIQSVPAKNVYRTKLSKLRLILLADMLNEVPPPTELITCLSNSSSLNVTTKHCDCESYSCKDLLTSSPGSSPFNSVNQRKIRASCRDYCCRKKKFNRSIEPTIQNAVAAVFRHNTIAPVRTKPNPGERQLESTDRMSSTPLQLMTPVVSGGSSSSHAHLPARARSRRNCDGSAANQIAISSNDKSGQGERHQPGPVSQQLPWLYRVVLIEKAMTICAGTLIHPDVLLTTAVCVINKNPDELIARRQSTESASGGGEELSRAVRRILLPGQFAKTFERLENNVALLVLQQDENKQQQESQHQQQPSDDRVASVLLKQVLRSSTDTTTTWSQQLAETEPPIVRSGRHLIRGMAPVEHLPDSVAENKQNFHEPSYICLSSIINHPSALSNICRTYSWRKLRGSAASFPGNGHNRAAGGGTRQRRNQRPRQRPRYQAPQLQHRPIRSDDGTNYITTNISIFPANGSECRREHRNYLQHQGNLCAGPVDKSQTLDVDFSGSPLICTEQSHDGKVRVELRGILTWSTDINRVPHLFTNVTTYRSWIEDELDKLDQLRGRSRI
ncbi:uncharacterized protein LOC131690289 [Topomyia yanbarensis]|uniref:uncharacterized protein LOC131690289 n=1 Tax=Topomyia yanbarensis TaxID=2498891 RepID=UPI00273C39FB|nr:uncharacterized protein LOC131690289 [Topomyia yanbarensis]XP_058831930.1 uncharacterized protein LOC131690289 [Topomyia yanbarensis]XP_058831931.1 uncharacterized protein LOC131690289 [Topomyia yanbarensis]